MLLFGYVFFQPAMANMVATEMRYQQALRHGANNKNILHMVIYVENLHKSFNSSLNWFVYCNKSIVLSQQDKIANANYQKRILAWYCLLKHKNIKILLNTDTLEASFLENIILYTHCFLLEQIPLLSQKHHCMWTITHSCNPNLYNEIYTISDNTAIQNCWQVQCTTAYNHVVLVVLQEEALVHKENVNKILAQISSNNYHVFKQIYTECFNNLYKHGEDQLRILYKNINAQSQSISVRDAEKKKDVIKQRDRNLIKSLTKQLQANRMLANELNNQDKHIDTIHSQQRKVEAQILHVRQVLNTIIEQTQWLGSFSILGKNLRDKVATLPAKPKLQQLNSDMIQLRIQRLQFENQLEKLSQYQLKHKDANEVKNEEHHPADIQLQIKEKLLHLLLSKCDTQIIELDKLKMSINKLIESLNKIQDAAHRYLFWVPNVNPITLSYPQNIAHNLKRFLSLETLAQLNGALKMMITNSATLISIFGALMLVIFNIRSRKHYHAFLARASTRVGKVTQDEFSLTIRTVFWSILIVLPLPVLWATLGFGLQSTWKYPMAEAIGKGVTATLPILWIFMIAASFAYPKGLFIVHFRWSIKKVALAMRYYKMSIWLIVPLIMALISFESFKEPEFINTLGRLCFIILCLALALVTNSLKRAGIPLQGSGNNVFNNGLWRLLLSAPLLAGVAASIGYLATAQALLARLETSVAIWCLLLLLYHIIRRWMLIQRRRIAFERAKHRRADILAQRLRCGEDMPHIPNNLESLIDLDESEVNLDAISTQSLQLVRSILTIIALVSVIVLWSEIHSAFSFLGNISLWDVNSMVNGMEIIHQITLGAVLIAILVAIITMQLVRNLPALLELTVLQHINLNPGTGYAITTITKYLLLLFGAMFSFSWIGIEWSKLKWVVTALSFGLGFGMQEIFSNFMSGLIILFEKPIRIGDTVTIRNLTGSVTKINTRTTTIVDWDRKEIIVPNKAFITEQFINWSLSDKLTRVVLTVAALSDANSEEVTQILMNAAKCCSLVLENPAPEVYLVDLQQGIQIFELRIYASEIAHRMPLRHQIHQLILSGYRQHGINLPFPPFQIRSEILSILTNNDGVHVFTPLHNNQREPGSL